MKYISHILTLLIGTMLFAACQSDDNIVDDSITTVKEIPVRFKTNLSSDPQTRGMLAGEEYPYVSSIQMLCFDSYGLFVGSRSAGTVTPNHNSPDNGYFEGTVPEVTARIHFIANYEVPVLSTTYIGEEENIMMQSEEASTYYENSNGIVFWGYHREEHSQDMKQWLVGGNTVYFLPDRAIVKWGSANDDAIEEIQSWVISNGRERGFIAPFNQASSNTDPFSGYYNPSNNTLNNAFTEYTTAGRYTALESKMEPLTNPLFLYEDVNLRETEATNTVKVILKVKYLQSKVGNIGNGNIRYQTVLLQDTENRQFTVTRGHRYVINLGKLPFELGYHTFAEAAATKTFSNGQTVSVAEEVSVLTNGKVEMDVNNGTTSIIYQSAANDQGQVKLLPFSFIDEVRGGAPYKLDAQGNETTTKVDATNFFMTIADNTGAISSSTSDVYIADYDQNTGIGHIAFKVGSISTQLQTAKINISDKTYGMSRNINIYTIDEFRLINLNEGTQTPDLLYSLTKVNGTTRTLRISNQNYTCDTYKLTFKIPGSYPSGLYPIEIKFATSTLNAYSDTQAGTAHGSFGVSVESTTALTTSNTLTDWNYNARNWGYWYTYAIPSPPTSGTDADGNYEVNIFFDDVRAFRGTQANSVGLFLKLQYFGDVKTVTL